MGQGFVELQTQICLFQFLLGCWFPKLSLLWSFLFKANMDQEEGDWNGKKFSEAEKFHLM